MLVTMDKFVFINRALVKCIKNEVTNKYYEEKIKENV